MAPSPFRLPKSRDRAVVGSYWLQPRSGLRSVCLLAACAAALVPLLVSFSALNATNQDTLEPPIAVCLVGSARAFEATGPSLLRHLLLPSAHPSSHSSGRSHHSHRSSHLSHPSHRPLHLFLHAPLDETAAKLALFGGIKGGGFGSRELGVEGVTIASVRIFASSDLDETDNRRLALNWQSSPQGLQGLLQYFRLVEGCWDMIQSFEAMSAQATSAPPLRYNWIVRARLDSLWTAPANIQPPPPMPLGFPAAGPAAAEEAAEAAALAAEAAAVAAGDIDGASGVGDNLAYTIPYGSDWWGLNDRFGMGGREASGVALRRLSALDKMVAVGYSQVNSEQGSKAQIGTRGVRVQIGTRGVRVQIGTRGMRVQRQNPFFCILTRPSHSFLLLSFLPVTPPFLQLNSEMAFKAQMDMGGLNSEMASKAQMDMGGVRVDRQNLSFCILTRRMYPLEDDSCPVKILSAAAKVPLNGAKCRLCTPCKAEEEAEQALAAIPDTAPNWPGPFTQGIDMCSIHQPWEDTWQQQYDAVMGAELARQRQAVTRMAADVALCVRSFERLRALSSVWSAPSPLALCVRGQLGEAKLLGSTPRQFATFTRLLSASRCAAVSGIFFRCAGIVPSSPSPLARSGKRGGRHRQGPCNRSLWCPSPLTRSGKRGGRQRHGPCNRSSPVSLLRSEGVARREGEDSQKAAESPSPFGNSELNGQKAAETGGSWEADLLSLFPAISILHRPPSWLQQWQQSDSTGGGERERGSQEDQGGEGFQRGEVAREEEYKREADDGLLWRVDVIKVDVDDLDPALIAAWASAMHDALSSGNTPSPPSSPSPPPPPPPSPSPSPHRLPSLAPRPLSAVCQLLVSFPVGEAATAARRHVDEQLQRAGFHLALCVGSPPDWDRQCCSYYHVRNCVR
ncbi:unnamed protein product [Closterium sp. Naga37s-1]|nr:unnamed protein product [Closterium sp. Naga37s-1]